MLFYNGREIFLYFWINGGGAGHIQSLILSGLLMGAGILLFVTGLISDLISVNRKLLEKIQEQTYYLQEKFKENLNG